MEFLGLNTIWVTVLFSLALILIGLTVTLLNDPYISAKHRRIMLAVIALSVSLVAQNVIEAYLTMSPVALYSRTVSSIYGYSVRPVFLVLFLSIVCPERRHITEWCMVAINAVIHMTALFSRLCFWIEEGNHMLNGPLSKTCIIISTVLLADLLYQSIRSQRNKSKGSLILPCVIVLMIVASVLLDRDVGIEAQPVEFLTYAIVVSAVFYYNWLHLQFVREHEEDLLARQRMQLMLSQIKPHFLYNSLGSIEALCDLDPKAAKLAARKFSQYLRGNMNSLGEEDLIPFEKELEHTRLYLDLEQIRYGDALRVEDDIKTRNFLLPTLTLEPIVENAVKHGIRMKADGRGTVSVSTAEYEDRYELLVTDDGAGFDPEAVPADGQHIGISSVRERLRRICGGTLEIYSAACEGTTAVIRIPKRKEGV